MSYHAAYIMPNHMHRLVDPKVLGHELVDVSCHLCLLVPTAGLGRVASSTVVWCDDGVACISYWRDYVAELIGALRKAVDQQYCSFRLCMSWRRASDVVDEVLVKH